MDKAFSGSSASINSLTSGSTGTLTTNHSRLVLTNSLCTTASSSLSVTSTMEIMEEKPFIPGIQIRASTIERLIERCVDCFDPVTGDLLSGNEYVHVLFMMHKWIMNSHDLASRFLKLYQTTMRNCQLAKKVQQRHRLMSDPPNSSGVGNGSVSGFGSSSNPGGNSPDIVAPSSPLTAPPNCPVSAAQPALTTSPSCTSTSSLQSSGNLQAESGYNGSVNNLASSVSSSELVHQKAAERSMKLALQHSYAPSSSAGCYDQSGVGNNHMSCSSNSNNNGNNNNNSNSNSNNNNGSCINNNTSASSNAACNSPNPQLERTASVNAGCERQTSGCAQLNRGSANNSFEKTSSNERDRDRDRECSSISISPESSSGAHAENDVLGTSGNFNINTVFFQPGSSSYAACQVDDETRKRVNQICFAMKYWITKMPVHFDTDDALAKCVADFTERLKNDGFVDMASVLDTSEVPTFDWMRMISVRCPPRNLASSRNMLTPRKTSRGGATTTNTEDNKVALVFNKLKPEVIADQLTVLEYKAFRRIPFNDFKQYAMTSSLDRCQRLERSIVLFNGLTQWVECMILSRTTPQERAEVISKFIEIAKRLYHLQNFNSLMAVVGGICHSAISRLSRTFACLDAEMHKILTTFSEFLSSSSNYSAYRRHLAQCREFRIPILGVHLKDLICTHTAMSDHVPIDPMNPNISSSCYNIATASTSASASACAGASALTSANCSLSNGSVVNLINFRKLVQLSLTFDELMQMQGASTPVEENTDLCNMLKLSLDMSYSEEEIYELSLAREPRNSLTNINASVKPVLFAEFVAGIRPPDPETVNKHVRDMVEAVFKVYDHDKDGFISQEEFEDITQNFPFIDAFCILDTDNDGVISRSEMLAYFIKGNSRLLRSSFKHNFHETTYFRPTYCAHCSGLLWGIIKQGWKCRDCGINAHRHCKDQIVCECRQRSASLGANANPALLDKENKRIHQRATATASAGGSSTARCNSHDGVTAVNSGGVGGIGHEKAEHLGKPVVASSSDRRRHQHAPPLERNAKSVRRRHTIHTCQGTQTDDVILEETLHEMNEQFEENESSVMDSRCSSASMNSNAGPSSTSHVEAFTAQNSSIRQGLSSNISSRCNFPVGQLITTGFGSAVSRPESVTAGPNDSRRTPTDGSSSSELLFTHNSIARTSSTSSIGVVPTSVSPGSSNEVARSASACCPSMQDRKPFAGKSRVAKVVEDRPPATRVQKSRVKFAQIRNSVSSAESTGSTNSLVSITSTNDVVPAATSPGGPTTFQPLSYVSVATQMPAHCASVGVGTDEDFNSGIEFEVEWTASTSSATSVLGRTARKDGIINRPTTMSDCATSPSAAQQLVQADSPFYETAEEHYRRLLKAETQNEQLALENAQLKSLLRSSQEQLQMMRAQMNDVRHHTIEFILHQMDVLHVQRDSEV